MKKMKMTALLLSAVLMLGSCSASNTVKGGVLGGAAGALLGGVVGKLSGNTAVGAAVGTAVGATAGVLIGKKMDKAAEEARRVENAKVEEITDANGLPAVKVTFDSGILFATGKSDLNSASKTALSKFSSVLISNPTMDIAVFGHTDNTGSLATNQRLSSERANSVATYLKSNGVASVQFKSIAGKDFQEPVASNDTPNGRQQNRRVEVFMYASAKMIEAANAGK